MPITIQPCTGGNFWIEGVDGELTEEQMFRLSVALMKNVSLEYKQKRWINADGPPELRGIDTVDVRRVVNFYEANRGKVVK